MRDLKVHSRLSIPESELKESFVRSTGPGGQNVNKVSTKVELRWSLVASSVLREGDRAYLLIRLKSRLTEAGEMIVVFDEHRTQLRNRQGARDKMAALIQKALLRPKKRRATKPTRGSVKRRLATKKRRSDIKKNRGKTRMDD